MQHKLYGTYVKCEWIGLYEWGKGWVVSLKPWRDFWSGKGPRYYRYIADVPPMNSSDAISLHSASYANWNASIYLHPMGFDAWITGTDKTELDAAVTHLRILCEKAVELYDGAKCNFKTAEAQDALIVNDSNLF